MLNRALSRQASAAIVALCVLVLCVVGALLMELERTPPSSEPEPFARARTTPDAAAARFVGADACAGCHPGEFQEHRGSRHAHTLRRIRRDGLTKEFPTERSFTDAETGTAYRLAERADRVVLEAASAAGTESRPIDFALGSGKVGITFVSLEEPHALWELRVSYFPRRHAWEVTPGQRGAATSPIGRRYDGALAQRCLACHATVLPESRLAPQERFDSVGCEACHGPGQAHVQAARAGRGREGMEPPSARGAARLNHLCGECHRSEREIDPLDDLSLSQTQRFQPYGLMKSACFQKSGDRLSCATCHNPHRDAATGAEGYEQVCRSCHSSGGKLCPVNPRASCVRCHMPHREVVRGMTMADHWIRVFR